VENRVCLSHGVQVVGVVWRAATMVVAGVRDLVQRTGDDRTDRVLGGWAIESSSDDLCGLYHTQGDEERGILGLASKSRTTLCQWFGLKTTKMVCQWFNMKTIGTVSPDLASKPMATVFSDLATKLEATIFSSLASKPVAMVSPSSASKSVVGFLVEPQN
jgi:hypothetical protein